LTFLTAGAGVAQAGMPSFTLADLGRTLSLSELTRARIEAISFFLASLLVCAWVIKLLWNGLRKDFPRLPRLSYGKACGVVILWGLLFVLVLTMISGARELLTPGAWEKSGQSYSLVNDPAEVATRQIAARYESIERLRDALRRYRQQYLAFPGFAPSGALPQALRDVPTLSGQRYIYLGAPPPSDEPGRNRSVVLYEADTFGPDRLVVTADGDIVWMPVTEIEQDGRARTP
jgi:hypothetical protein